MNSYLEERESALDDAKDVFLLLAMNFAAEIKREKASQGVRDTMTRKARAGDVCGAGMERVRQSSFPVRAS